MAKYQYHDEYITCVCGESFPARLETNLSDRLWDSTLFDTDLAEEQQYHCPKCNCQYNLEIRVEKQIVTTFQKVELLGQYFIDVDGDEWVSSQLGAKEQLDHVPLPDGIYLYDGKEYHVKSQNLITMWSTTDENQLNLFEVTAA